MKWILWPLIAGLIVGGASLPKASADPVSTRVATEAITMAPAVCATLDDHPTTDGVAGVAMAIHDEGFTMEEAGQIIALSVLSKCPQHKPLLEKFIGVYGSKGQAA